MQWCSLTVVLVLSLMALVECDKDDISRFDNFNIEELLGSERILKNYIKCMLDKGPCTSEGKAFKRSLPNVLMTGCSKCTAPERRVMRRLSSHLRSRKPQDWELIATKYNINGAYKDNFDAFLARND